MNEVGNFKGDEPQRSDEEQTHWGLWSVVSAPLVLGCNLNDSAVVDRIWPIITNQDAERVNRAWAGRPGTLIRQYPADPSGMGVLRLGQSPCDGSPKTTGWALTDEGQLRHAFDSAAGSDNDSVVCVSTQNYGSQVRSAEHSPFRAPLCGAPP